MKGQPRWCQTSCKVRANCQVQRPLHSRLSLPQRYRTAEGPSPFFFREVPIGGDTSCRGGEELRGRRRYASIPRRIPTLVVWWWSPDRPTLPVPDRKQRRGICGPQPSHHIPPGISTPHLGGPAGTSPKKAVPSRPSSKASTVSEAAQPPPLPFLPQPRPHPSRGSVSLLICPSYLIFVVKYGAYCYLP